MTLKNRLKLTLPAIITALIIFILSHQPNLSLPDFGFKQQDKVFHFVAYLVFGFTLMMAIAGNIKLESRKKIIIISLILGGIYGISDEIHQYFIPGRTADFFDFLADFSGILLATFLISIVSKISKRFN